jgi:hypothetical protein
MEKKDLYINSKKYIFSFYGKDEGIYKDFFDNELTKDDLETHFPIFMKSYLVLLKNHDHELKHIMQDAFDSFDREIFRDYLLVKLENVPIQELDYNETIKEILQIEEQLNRRKKIIHLKMKI